MSGRIDAERILDAVLAPEADRLPDRVIDAALADIARTPQRRALRVPWRFPLMPAISRTTSIAAAVLVVALGAGALVYLNGPGGGAGGPGGSPTPPSTPIPSAAPTPSASAATSEVAPGITGWTTYTSTVYGHTLGYPDDWDFYGAATREWQAGDRFGGETPWADTFASPDENGDDQVGVWVWKAPAGEGSDVESRKGLEAWAETFCSDFGDTLCQESTEAVVPMCLDAGGDPCRAAIIVPNADGIYAFFADWPSVMITSMPDEVIVVSVGRPDSHPSTARYGGSVELLKSILTTMNVWTPGEVPPGT